MIRQATHDEVDLDKELNVTMTVADLAIIHALIAVSSDATVEEYIRGQSGYIFGDESLVSELQREVDMQDMYHATSAILTREGLKLV